MFIRIKVLKSNILQAYNSRMEMYPERERLRYMSYAKADPCGWLREDILGLVGITSGQATLWKFREDGMHFLIDYQYPHDF